MEFNTGLPPAGEAGMLNFRHLRTGNRCFAMSCGFYRGDAHLGQNLTFAANSTSRHDFSDVTDWRWATLAELTAAGIPESEARGMVHKSMLPEAAADAEWGPWIFCERGSKCPIPHAKAGEYAVRWAGGGKLTSHEDLCFGDDWDAVRFWDCAAGDFAYRLKRSAAKLEDKPATAATHQTECDPDKAMMDRDAIVKKAIPKPADEGWREYDPKYPPFGMGQLEFDKRVDSNGNDRHFYRVVGVRNDGLDGIAILREHRAERYGRLGNFN